MGGQPKLATEASVAMVRPFLFRGGSADLGLRTSSLRTTQLHPTARKASQAEGRHRGRSWRNECAQSPTREARTLNTRNATSWCSSESACQWTSQRARKKHLPLSSVGPPPSTRCPPCQPPRCACNQNDHLSQVGRWPSARVLMLGCCSRLSREDWKRIHQV